MSVLDDVKGFDHIWLVGDNFMATTYRQHFDKLGECYMKKNFEVSPFCSSRFESNNTNLLSRIQVTMVKAINKTPRLPRFIIFTLDDDMIEFLNYRNYGVSTLYGSWLEWLLKEIDSAIQTRYSQLPAKSRNKDEPQIYWVMAPYHKEFTDGEMRSKFNHCLESVIKMYGNMRLIRLKEIWNQFDTKLVINGRISSLGFTKYWKAVDAAVKFNVAKREEFLAKKRQWEYRRNESLIVKKAKLQNQQQGTECGKQPGRINWNRCQHGDKFALPRVKGNSKRRLNFEE